MTQEHLKQRAARLPSCASDHGLLHAMALMAEHRVKLVLVRDQANMITGVYRLEKNRILFEPVGS